MRAQGFGVVLFLLLGVAGSSRADIIISNLPGNDVSLLPGDMLPECAQCGDDGRWVKI